MKAKLTFLLAYGFCAAVHAQNLEQAPEPRIPSDEVQKAIDEFNRMKKEKAEMANEVTVVLEPSAPKAVAVEEEELKDTPEESPSEKPILVTGKPQAEAEAEARMDNEDKTTEPTPETEIVESPEEAPVPEEPGLEVRVESIRKGTGKLDPKNIKLRASFPAKPLSSPPTGWVMEKSEGIPPLNRDIELQPGTIISLEISPHILVPDSDGSNIFAVNEPGFHAIDGYRQKQTVSAILAKSVLQLDEDAKQLGNALSELNQILSSLPQPATPEPQPTNNSEKP
jgi:hypothetical protein